LEDILALDQIGARGGLPGRPRRWINLSLWTRLLADGRLGPELQVVTPLADGRRWINLSFLDKIVGQLLGLPGGSRLMLAHTSSAWGFGAGDEPRGGSGRVVVGQLKHQVGIF
jgi:hypothetical protein